ncbi:hypothetical protein [Gymnodinialimonas ceratoperidinii]|uniref:Uncharacterized protein n=1 Tax=Gymnodinialimonas ceratoperidinii TaxID=2856823 RepID=A0A8F6YA18_9RHOB|nr:hypothetical protein [Gymnodinialimonas ceratoperidinii]QXT39113.1 hypothetical protein KYE46_14445 [Gymnodinialimonas ceratoperidinii]
MKTGTILAIAIAAIVLVAGIYMIDIDQTEEAALPEVTVDGGNLPEFDAEVGEVEITEETVTVPGLEITAPDDAEVASN